MGAPQDRSPGAQSRMGPAVTISLGERWGASEGRRSGRGEGDGHGGCVGRGSERSRELEQERAPQPLTLAGAGSPSVIVGSKANGAREVSCSRSRWPKSACRGEQGRGHWSQTSTPGHAFPRTPRRLRWGLPIPVAPAWSGRLLRAQLSLRPAPGSPAWQGLTSEPRTGLGPCSLSLGELHPDAGVLLLLGEESEGWGEGMAVRGHVAWRGWGGPLPSGWPQGRKEAARHPPPVPLDTHFSKVSLLQDRRRPSQQSWGAAPTRPLPSVWDTPRQPPTAALGRAPLPGWGLTKRDKACHQPTPRGLTAEGLCRPPPEARRGALLPEQGVLPPLQGLLGLVTQLQVGLRDCGSTGVARPVPGFLGSVPRPPSRSSPRWAVQRKPGCAAGAPSPPHFGALSFPGGVPAGLSPHLSYAEESVLGGRWAGWEREAGSC